MAENCVTVEQMHKRMFKLAENYATVEQLPKRIVEMAENRVTVEQLRKRMVELAAIESSTLKEKVVNTYRVIPVPGARDLGDCLTIRSKTLIGAIIAYLDWVEMKELFGRSAEKIAENISIRLSDGFKSEDKTPAAVAL